MLFINRLVINWLNRNDEYMLQLVPIPGTFLLARLVPIAISTSKTFVVHV